MAKKKAAKARRAAGGGGSPRVSVQSDTVRMKFNSRKDTDECRAVSVEGACYKRTNDGTFIVSRQHLGALQNQGLRIA